MKNSSKNNYSGKRNNQNKKNTEKISDDNHEDIL